ncbi:RimK family alpha-L-glutamate ligase [Rheinheimera sp. D18]|uniref:RimK family protein n=1 Tax=Rheinheimera sp. D18 TaxID=2545632 RepID=UPI0010500059|nr:RimK family protein [Rheinheimera sp. D18]QBL09990.1 RimK family alpha-L-glutamate ligase [Rheinheimera sp. D18]
MAKLIIVVDKAQDWAPFYQYDGVMTLPNYLKWSATNKQRTRVINLCRQAQYLGTGYYCSLLAEARGHNVMPSVRAFNKFNRHEIADIADDVPITLLNQLNKALIDETSTQLTFNIYFGETELKALKKVATYLFEAFPVPILRVELQKKKTWHVKTLKIGSVHKLSESEQGLFGNILERYSHKIWRVEPANKKFKYDLAVLIDAKEKFPPCTPKALELFVKAAKRAAMDVEHIGAKDIHRLAEFDGLFIRETTAVNHHTFHMALKAEREGLAVIDDPNSILRCGNKVYLHTLFEQHKVPMPDGVMLFKQDDDSLVKAADTLGLPLVLKIPDGSFSRGVVKVKTLSELKTQLSALFEQSAIILAQRYTFTEYDWRIGVLNGQAIFACKYFMARNHWQIYKHGTAKTESGGFSTCAVADVPSHVVQAALQACAPIGDSLYGVDVKQDGDKVYVIEVNDNPNIDDGVEDLHLGNKLYDLIVSDFIRRIELKR